MLASRVFCIFGTMETLVSTINFVQYHNPENGFSILKVIPEGSMTTYAMQIKMMEPMVGMTIKAEGEWTKSKFGLQFSVSDWEEQMPASLIGIEGYLSSGLIHGIGPVYAKKIVQTFGTDTFNVLDNTPERLREVHGIGEKRCNEIIESWTKHRAVRNLAIFLKKYNLSTKLIVKIYRCFGDDAISIVKDNPYRLADNIEGISFKIADSIGINVGIEIDDPRRVQCGIKCKMMEMSDDGDTYSTLDDIVYFAGEMLEVEPEIIEENVERMVENGFLIDCNGNIYLKYLYDCETFVAQKISTLSNYPQIDSASKLTIEQIEERTGFHYEGNQVTAIETALNKNFMILTGGPGTGKTTVIKGIIELLSSMGKTIALAAPTGKAAKRMSELTGRQAKTIHRLLDYNPANGFAHCVGNPLIEDVLVVDETSMVNITLMDSLMRAVRDDMKVILVGDIDQLPCIGPGNILKDCIASHVVPVITLDKIFRQSAGSNIIKNAHSVKNGNPITIDNSADSDFFFMKRDEVDMQEIVDLVVNRLPKKYGYTPNDVQVLTPMKKCEIGVDNLNIELQKAINPVGEEVKYGKFTYRVGDKVLQTVNDYEKDVFNGDIGFIDAIHQEDKSVVIRFDSRIVPYLYSELDEISLAYAMTVHKSQGSEYPIVVIPITYANKIMMQRNLIYTAITRAKNICVIIGSRKMVELGIGKANSYKRKTMLKERLIENSA